MNLEYLRDRSILIVDYMLQINPENLPLRQVRAVIETTFENGDLKGMKLISRDVNAWSNGMSKSEILGLENVLKKYNNENLSGDKLTVDSIKEVLQRNKILHLNEFRLVKEYLNDISKESVFWDKADIMEELLKEFKA